LIIYSPKIKVHIIKEIKNKITDLYSKEKINEKQYNLLKEKISELENKNNNNFNGIK